MNVYITEEEQLEKIRQWFKNYGPTLILSILIAIVFSLGWNYWQQIQEKKLEQASGLYEQVQINLLNQNINTAKATAAEIKQKFPHTPYGSLAALILAKMDLANNQMAAAEHELSWAMEYSKDPAIANLAILRLARVFIADGKAAQALDVVKRVKDKAFQPLAKSIEGDAYAALKDNALASQAYQQSLNDSEGSNNPNRTLVQMKLSSLAINNS